MRKLNVLFITKYMRSFIEKSTFYLGEELQELCNLMYWYEDGNLPDIIHQVPVRPDFILFNDQKPDYCPWIRHVDKVTIPKGTLVHDLHYRIPRRKKMYQIDQIEHLFVQYRDAFLKWYPEYKDQMIWLPHHVPQNIFKEYKQPKQINLLMVGILLEYVYPLRVAMHNRFRNEPGFMYVQHPGYRNIPENRKSIPTGVSYAKILNQSKVFLTCDSIYQFPLLKYFEAAACGTLLLAPGSEELRELGFIDGETFVDVNEKTFYDKALYFLQHAEERERIAKKAKQMIQQRHTTKIRAKQLLTYIEQIVSKDKGERHV
ncbi:glycosyltransferase [Alkalihalobacillus sp. AL-G]|uniref:glycosyltransferase n=1 Tax=Alkalihalobacillus sp. AL-G TaxID=2926399 RepID=UPI00272C7FC0|nr:glycosyltransferase [Alkalihalobacillus sp. AL-G]WLD94948.1 glycosyltransferase [Alkalihalobacillus sp. AL-G]